MKETEYLLPHLSHRVLLWVTDLSMREALIEPIAEVISAIETDVQTHPRSLRVLSAHWSMLLEILRNLEAGNLELATSNLLTHKSILDSHLKKEPDLKTCKFHEAFEHFNQAALHVLAT